MIIQGAACPRPLTRASHALIFGVILAVGCRDNPTGLELPRATALGNVQAVPSGLVASELPASVVIAAIADDETIPFVSGIAYTGQPEQIGVLTASDGGFPTSGLTYLVVSSGDGRDPHVDGHWNWQPYPGSPCDPCYPGTGDVASVSISLALPPSAVEVEFDYRFFTADDVHYVRPMPWYEWASLSVSIPGGSTLGGVSGSPMDLATCGSFFRYRCTRGFTWFPDGVRRATIDVRSAAGETVVLRADTRDFGRDNGAQTGLALDGLRVVLSNLPPVASAGGPYTVDEGTPFDLDGGNSSDPEHATLTYAWDLDADGAFDDATTAQTVHTFTDDGSYLVALRVTDPEGASATTTATVTVRNIAPILSVEGPSLVHPVLGQANVPLDIQFTDPGADSHSATIDCDNGLPPINRADVASPFRYVCSYASSAFGPRSIHVTVTDDDGGVGNFSHATRVLYQWSGFFAPIENAPAMNTAKAGSALPVKFSLDGYQGLDVLRSGSPSSQRTSCGTGSIGTAEATFTPGKSGLSYDNDTGQYQYVWKTEKRWAGTCRRLVVDLGDGTVHQAEFQFK